MPIAPQDIDAKYKNTDMVWQVFVLKDRHDFLRHCVPVALTGVERFQVIWRSEKRYDSTSAEMQE